MTAEPPRLVREPLVIPDPTRSRTVAIYPDGDVREFAMEPERDEFRREVAGGWGMRRSAGETLAVVDATVEGRCAGPGCSAALTEDSPSRWWCSPDCQEAWSQHQAGPPSPGAAPVRGSEGVDPSRMRWRPDLVAAFDDSGWTLLDEHRRDDTGFSYRVYTSGDSDRAFLRVDDGNRFVGLEVEWVQLEGPPGPSEPFRRLERELADPRRLDTASDGLPPTPLLDGQTTEEFAAAWASWGRLLAASMMPSPLVAAAVEAEQDRARLRVVCGNEAMYQHALTSAASRGWTGRQMAEAVACGRYTEQGWADDQYEQWRQDLHRQMGIDDTGEPTALDAVRGLGRGAEPTATWVDETRGGVFWLPDQPADPEAPTAVELAGGIDLTPHLADGPPLRFERPDLPQWRVGDRVRLVNPLDGEPAEHELEVTDVADDGTVTVAAVQWAQAPAQGRSTFAQDAAAYRASTRMAFAVPLRRAFAAVGEAIDAYRSLSWRTRVALWAVTHWQTLRDDGLREWLWSWCKIWRHRIRRIFRRNGGRS